MRLFKIITISMFMVLQFTLVSANEDLGKDLPYFSRMPNYFVSSEENREFDEYTFFTNEGKVRIEGKKYKVQYDINDDMTPASVLQIYRNYTNAVLSRGGAVIFNGEDIDENRDIVTLTLKNGAKELWLELYAWNQGTSYIAVMIEKEAMSQQVKADGLLNELNANGHVPVYINFDFGKATIPANQMPVIDEVYRLLAGNPGLNLQIQGHTDNIGSAESNKLLSEQRAKAVVNLLVQKGISPNRLSAVGYGPTKPIAANSSEEGRVKNRRVELVKQ